MLTSHLEKLTNKLLPC